MLDPLRVRDGINEEVGRLSYRKVAVAYVIGILVFCIRNFHSTTVRGRVGDDPGVYSVIGRVLLDGHPACPRIGRKLHFDAGTVEIL